MDKVQSNLRELYDTEKNYNRYINALNDVYFQEIIKNCRDHESMIKFCLNFQPIVGLHNQILDSLSEIYTDQILDDNAILAILSVLSNHAQAFKLYRPFLQQFQLFQTKFFGLSSKKPVKAIYENGIKDPRCSGQSFESLMINPVQRLPRYTLILKELLKTIKPNENNEALRLTIQTVLTKISELVADCNESMKMYSDPKNIFNIWDKWGRNPQILKPSRKYIKEDDLLKKKQKIHFVLFDDSLMYGTSSSMFGGGGGSGSGNDGGKTNYKFHRLIDLNNARVNSLDETKYPLSFQLVSTIKSFIINCGNIKEYNEWYNILKSEIIQLKKIRIIREYKKIQNQSSLLIIDEDRLREIKLLVKKHEKWSIDTSSTFCMKNECSAEFGIFKKRIMCIKCGKTYCEKCIMNNNGNNNKGENENEIICNECYLDEKNNSFDEQENPIINENELISCNLDNSNNKKDYDFISMDGSPSSPEFLSSENQSSKSLTSQESVSVSVKDKEVEKEVEIKEEEEEKVNIIEEKIIEKEKEEIKIEEEKPVVDVVKNDNNNNNSKRRKSHIMEEIPKEPVSLEIKSNIEEYDSINENLIDQSEYNSKKVKVKQFAKALQQSFYLFLPELIKMLKVNSAYRIGFALVMITFLTTLSLPFMFFVSLSWYSKISYDVFNSIKLKNA